MIENIAALMAESFVKARPITGGRWVPALDPKGVPVEDRPTYPRVLKLAPALPNRAERRKLLSPTVRLPAATPILRAASARARARVAQERCAAREARKGASGE